LRSMLRARFRPITPKPAMPMSASAIAQNSSTFSDSFFVLVIQA
jgi:hypothetical protein